MRGFPLINLLAVLLLLAGTAWPLARISRPARADGTAPRGTGGGISAEPEKRAEDRTRVTLLLRFAQEPEQVTVRSRAGEVALRGGGRDWQGSAELDMGGDLLELEVQARWPAGVTQGFVEVRVEPEGREARQLNLWSTGAELDDLAHFAWERRAAIP